MGLGVKKSAETSVEVLVMVRHGDYEGVKKYDWKDGPLLSEQREAVASTANLLKQYLLGLNYLEPGTTLMVTSDKIRAQETAEILRDILGITCITIPALGLNESGEPYHTDVILKALHNLILPNGGYEGLVVVTHEHQTTYLPELLHPKVHGLQARLYYANAALYDNTGNVQYFSPNGTT